MIAPVNPMSADGKETVLHVMRRDRANFIRLVSDPKNWTVQTRCTEWETRDLVGHMIDVTEGYFRNWDAATGNTEPTAPMGLPVMAETLDDHAKAFRSLPREEAIERFKKNAEKLDKMLDGLTPEQWEGGLMVSHPYSGPVPAGFYASFQVMDYGVHPYDIEYGLGNKLATIDEASAGIILPFAFIFWQYQVDQKEAEGQDFTYGIDVAGPWGGKWRITVKDGKWTPQPEKGNFEGCDALFHFDSAADLVLTFFGRFPGGSASGDPAVIDKVRHLHFSI
ncbi:MAG TPA: maleylpyruvate isomerase family mycothiol-dependent enzyme [Candidatus Dormibacteraeota bacterium]|nr:maleylpyruvate isomerase family mycothiol-dependent enzyme [Candidatus Dormibacteraeota bacterium]